VPGDEVQPRPLSQAGPAGHVAPRAHAEPPQVTSHEQALLQLMVPWQAPEPLHAMSQGPVPHWIAPRQALLLEHSMSQEDAELQFTPDGHDASPWHRTRHGTPTGQKTVEAQLFG
jgi:hypothetical protein